jgi:hypothetical protein
MLRNVGKYAPLNSTFPVTVPRARSNNPAMPLSFLYSDRAILGGDSAGSLRGI